ncbi:AGE family epimerase/isomerase [Aliiroseovarius sp. PrR006]|uniref:AGE family epimerase/isomerase n=1 Tax=Aliiroseovarius sp. PrR006 TaxID=2706883 RepID=UPI0013D4FD34|nr:AGE family epimerase/isomerase [Aliiroseovarius sp. PrR006]NDW54611.1 mannose-6-phosphate isomerase [Aliiroseovarius sp. PrR006]
MFQFSDLTDRFEKNLASGARPLALLSKKDRTLLAMSNDLSTWFHEKALPLWADRGFCFDECRFIEGLCENDQPIRLADNRARIQPRQIYAFTSAWMRGWRGMSPEMIVSSLEWFTSRYRRSDGTFGNIVSAEGFLTDPRFDLYNQSFVLLMFAQMAQFQPKHKALFEAEAVSLLRAIKAGYTNAHGGYLSGPAAEGFMESNPHMHLFEAALAWESVAKDNSVWRDLSDEIGALAIKRMIDPSCGTLGEYFNSDWTPAPGTKGEIVEPGHQFEWAWLLVRWAKRCNNPWAKKAALRQYKFGRKHGTSKLGLVMMSVGRDAAVIDPTARLWSQTEWLKAATLFAQDPSFSGQHDFMSEIIRSLHAISAFLNTKENGSWIDRIDPNGHTLDAKAPASSLYHIASAVYELEDALEGLTHLKHF